MELAAHKEEEKTRRWFQVVRRIDDNIKCDMKRQRGKDLRVQSVVKAS